MIQTHTLIRWLKSEQNAAISDHYSRISEVLAAASKFKVTNRALLEPPELMDYSLLLINSGVLRLPFAACYFEADGFGEDAATLGILAFEIKAGFVRTFTFAKSKNTNNEWGLSPVSSGWSFGSEAEEGKTNFLKTNLLMGLSPYPYGSLKDAEFISELGAEFAALCIAFMDIKEVSIQDNPASEKINRARIARGKLPFYAHKTLTIKPKAGAALATHVGPLIARRAHWRRGHLRHLPSKIVRVAPALVRGEGFVSKDYRI